MHWLVNKYWFSNCVSGQAWVKQGMAKWRRRRKVGDLYDHILFTIIFYSKNHLGCLLVHKVSILSNALPDPSCVSARKLDVRVTRPELRVDKNKVKICKDALSLLINLLQWGEEWKSSLMSSLFWSFPTKTGLGKAGTGLGWGQDCYSGFGSDKKRKKTAGKDFKNFRESA